MIDARFWPVAALTLALAAACGPTTATRSSDPAVSPDESPEELYRRADLFMRTGDLVRAEQYFATAIARGYPATDAMPSLLRVCIASSRLHVALTYARPYLAEHPNDWALRYLVANIYIGLRDPENARRELSRIVVQVPDQPEPHYVLATLLVEGGDSPDAAREHLTRYLALAPDGEHAAQATDELARLTTAIRATRATREGVAP